MPLREFWISIRTAARFLLSTAIADSPKLNADQIEKRLRETHIWLTPKSVEGFDEQDFQFLAEDARERLTRYVNEFVSAAQQVPPDQPVAEQELEAALRPFLCILEIMRPDKYGDIDAFVIGKQVEQQLDVHLPDGVHEMRFETGEDANGDPAVWIWVYLDDADKTDMAFAQKVRKVRERIEDCIRNLGVDRWPYVRFRRSSEHAEALKQD